MRPAQHREYLQGLLERHHEDFAEFVREVLTRKKRIHRKVQCERCRNMKNIDIEIEVYSVKDVAMVYRYMADFGVGKPAEEKKVEVDINVEHRHIQELSQEELLALASAEDADYSDAG